VRLWDIRAGSEPVKELELGAKVTSVDVCRRQNYFLACCRDDTLRLIDSRSCQLVRTFCTEGFQVGCDWTRATFSPDSEYVTVGSGNGKIFIWHVEDQTKVETVLSEHTASVSAVAWQPAGNSLTTCDKSKTVVVWAAI
jgi:autophagy-related protein 16